MNYSINNAVVIGSGTMGAAIAAHLANAGTQVYLLDIVPNKLTENEKNQGLTLQDQPVRNRTDHHLIPTFNNPLRSYKSHQRRNPCCLWKFHRLSFPNFLWTPTSCRKHVDERQ